MAAGPFRDRALLFVVVNIRDAPAAVVPPKLLTKRCSSSRAEPVAEGLQEVYFKDGGPTRE
ncbi:hypothetical protein ACFU8Q_30000 [Streptomyces sp. NPDC057543]|uniref:hypothetical protein n=1 Tax=Streptomyces sp. NPDC057543 TaxID=3346163 RepID=UPI0036742F56